MTKKWTFDFLNPIFTSLQHKNSSNSTEKNRTIRGLPVATLKMKNLTLPKLFLAVIRPLNVLKTCFTYFNHQSKTNATFVFNINILFWGYLISLFFFGCQVGIHPLNSEYRSTPQPPQLYGNLFRMQGRKSPPHILSPTSSDTFLVSENGVKANLDVTEMVFCCKVHLSGLNSA